MNIDDEIRQDFLVEAGELFDMLGEQIIELEQSPEDAELLNAIFRAFHTIKGGAGFLKLTQMVEVCHRAEDVFNILRQGERVADAELIDVILQVIDVVGDMFDQLRAEETLTQASPELLKQLEQLASGQPAQQNTAVQQNTGSAAELNDIVVAADEQHPTAVDNVDSMDDEFEAMLRDAQTQSAESSATELEPALVVHDDVDTTARSDDLISDDEFENLLDQLHGAGKHGGVPGQPVEADTGEDQRQTVETSDKSPVTTASSADIITDDEFEAVLDQMYGKNSGPGAAVRSSTRQPAEQKPTDKVAEETSKEAQKETLNEAPENKPVKQKSAQKRKATHAQAESSVRVDTSRLDDIMNLVGELVLVRNRLSTLKQLVGNGQVVDAISNLELVTSDLQASVMKTRMQPIKKVFNRFPRVIRDLARKLGKDIELKLVGEETDLDKNLVEALADPLIHLVRNSVDHGIEPPEQRFADGKPRQGTVMLSAVQEGDQILITISDDGKGMNPQQLRKIAVEKGLMSTEAANSLTDNEACNLIFAPGFSTKTEVSDVSGRGVGMDVVKTRISELNGILDIDSKMGQGTVITIRLPLTLAILPTLMITLADYQFALPLGNVIEAFNMDTRRINMVDGQEVIRVRNTPLPLYYLQRWLVHNSAFSEPQPTDKIIVVQMGSQKFCIVVNHLIGQEEVVIKPLGHMIADTPGFAGATITGDGDIALVLDMPGLMKHYASAA